MAQAADEWGRASKLRLSADDLTVDVEESQATLAGATLTLSPKAHALLVTLMCHRGALEPTKAIDVQFVGFCAQSGHSPIGPRRGASSGTRVPNEGDAQRGLLL